MSYPVGWDLVNITGTYVGRNGVPCVGSVTLSSPQLVLRSGTIVPAADIVFDLVNGVFSGQIPATDDPNAQPSGWVYTVTENVPGGRQGYQIVAPHTSPGIDLSTVIPVLMPMPPTFGFPYVTLSQLAAPGGSALIGYQNAGTGAVVRTVQSKLQETISVMDYGATGNGVTDDTAAIQAALNEAATTGGPRRVYFPMGTYVVSSGFTINHPLRLVGEGPGAAAFEGAPAENGTRIKYTGSSGATLFAFTNVNFGNGGIEGMWLDCNGLAANGLVLDGCMSGRFTDVTVGNFTVCGLKLTGTTTTCSWNTFTNMVFESGTQTSGTKAAIWLSGVVGGSNACHNSFITTKMDIAGSFHGIYLGGCDNNAFLMTYIFRSPGATGNGVYVDPTEMSNFPVNNTFFHLEASTGGWYQPSGTASLPAKIVGYMMDNGQPLPSLNLNGSTVFDCVDTTFPVTVAAGTGWSGGTPTFQAWYRIDSQQIFLTILITGTGVVAAANATITGIPPNTGNQRGLAVGSGVNVGGSAQPVYGYISGSTLTIQSGITSTSSAQMTFVYEI